MRRITNEILGIKGLSSHALISTFSQISAQFNVKQLPPLSNHPPYLPHLLNSRDKWKTCFYCQFISNFFKLQLQQNQHRRTISTLLNQAPSCPWGTPPLSVKILNKPQGAYFRKWSTFIRNEEIKESTEPQKSFCWYMYLRAYPHFDIILHERLIFSVLKYKIYCR